MTQYTVYYLLCIGTQLMSVGLLGLAVFLIYAVLSFAFLHDFFNPYDMDYNLFCNTLIQCYVTLMREGLLNTIGIVSSIFNSHMMFALSHVTLALTVTLSCYFYCRNFLFDMLVKVTIHLLQFIGPELFLMLHSSLLWLHWAWILW